MRIGRKTDLLSPAEREIVDRFERGAIDAAEAGRLLIASVHRVGDGPAEASPPTPVETGAVETAATAAAADEAAPEEEPEFVVDPNETPEEAAARQLVERIAREVDEELKR